MAPDFNTNINGVATAANEVEAAKQKQTFVADYKAANKTEQERVKADIDKRLARLDKETDQYKRLQNLKESITDKKTTIGEDLKSAGIAAVEAVGAGVGTGINAAKYVGNQLNTYGAPAVQELRNDLREAANDVHEKKWGSAAMNIAPVAATGLGVVWAMKMLKEAFMDPIPEEPGKKKQGRLGKILRALGCALAVVTGVIGVTNGVKWAKNAIANSGKTPAETPAKTPTDASPDAKAPATKPAENKEEGQTQKEPSAEEKVASQLKQSQGKDLYTSSEITTLSINGKKVDIGNKKILIDGKPITISTKVGWGKYSVDWDIPLLNAVAADNGELNFTFQNPFTRKNVPYPATPGDLLKLVVSLPQEMKVKDGKVKRTIKIS